MRFASRRRAVIALAGVAAVAIAATAYAYFSSSGSGTATASVGSSASVTLHGTVGGNLYPGTSAPVTFTVDNPSSGKQRVGKITLASITPDASHSECVATVGGENPAFSMPAVTVEQVYGAGKGQSVSPTGTLTMNDTGINQDQCQGATLTLHLTSN